MVIWTETGVENKAVVKDGFRSLDPRIKTVEDIWELVGDALCNQEKLNKKTSPWEMVEWETDELECYVVYHGRIDRVYYIYEDGGFGVGIQRYQLLGRMRYGSRMSYFTLVASCDDFFDYHVWGYIYVTFDPQIFLSSVVRQDQNPHAIWTMMMEDGLKVHEPSPFDLIPVRVWRDTPTLKYLCHQTTPTLKYLCHQTIYKHRDILTDEAVKTLPPLVVNNIEEFIKIRDTRDHYELEGEYEGDESD